jgi:putative SOS response-associated peptidase YedK
MPVVIAPQDYERWLTARGDVTDLLRPAPDALMEAIPVSDRVNKADNDDPSLIARAMVPDSASDLPLFQRG